MTEKPAKYDLLIKDVRVVRPRKDGLQRADIAIKDGKVAKVAPGLSAADARQVVDGKRRLAFPGLVDPHMHTGIYGPLPQDARSESLAAAQGGVTSSLNYIRTGGYYMDRGGPYAEVYPEILAQSKDNFWVDYAYHLAPLDRTHIGEIDMLIDKYGVTSFKIFMFYGGYGLHGASNSQHKFLMIGEDEKYDI
ncbi:MAG: hydantoinase, partial [Gammaproteobacteria bacterium]